MSLVWCSFEQSAPKSVDCTCRLHTRENGIFPSPLPKWRGAIFFGHIHFFTPTQCPRQESLERFARKRKRRDSIGQDGRVGYSFRLEQEICIVQHGIVVQLCSNKLSIVYCPSMVWIIVQYIDYSISQYGMVWYIILVLVQYSTGIAQYR